MLAGSSRGQARYCLPLATGSIFPPVLFLIEKVFKCRLFQSQWGNWGQRGAQILDWEWEHTFCNYRDPVKSGLDRTLGLPVETSFKVKWKIMDNLTNLSSAVKTDTTKHIPWQKECNWRAVEQKIILEKVEKFASQNLRVSIQPISQYQVLTSLASSWVNVSQYDKKYYRYISINTGVQNHALMQHAVLKTTVKTYMSEHVSISLHSPMLSVMVISLK